MKIEQLTKANIKVELKALISEVKPLKKKNDDPFLQVTLQDDTGSINFPVWDNYAQLVAILKVGEVVEVTGKTIVYDGAVQIGSPLFEVQTGEIDYDLYVPSYKVPQGVVDYFIDTVNSLDHEHKMIAMGATGCLGYDKKRWAEFTTCVSAVKHHGNKRGGLLLHTVGVLRNVDAMIEKYIDEPLFYNAKDVINPSRLKLKAILHDIGKPLEYEYKGVIRYKAEKKIDHLISGITILNQINAEMGSVLSDEEIEDISYSILSHHGQWGKHEPKSPEDRLLHMADCIDAVLVGAIEG